MKRGDHVVDVGANHGLHTLPLARCVGWNGKVTAIEALPDLARKLARRTRWLPQVKIVNKAMSAADGVTGFTRVVRDEGLSGIRPRVMSEGRDDAVETVQLPQARLDTLCAGRSRKRISFIKIDVEGGEFDVIRGGVATIAAHRPLIVFEQGGKLDADIYGYSEDAFFDLFDRLDYALFDLFGRPLTRALWDDDDRPWYVIGAPRGGPAARFIKTELCGLIGSVPA